MYERKTFLACSNYSPEQTKCTYVYATLAVQRTVIEKKVLYTTSR